MNRRSRRGSNPWRVLVLILLIGGVLYVNRFVVPASTAMFIPTSTPTRSPESLTNEAQKMFDQGKMLPAIDAYKQAILVDPTNRSNYAALARVQVFAGLYEDAKVNAERSLIGNEDYSAGQAVLGWVLNYLGDYAGAETAVKKAIELDPNNAQAHAFYAEILANTPDNIGNVKKAAEESNLAVTLAPNMLEPLRARGYVLYQTGNYQEAIQKYQAAIALNSKIPTLYIEIGECYFSLDTEDGYNQAVTAYTQANALNPKDPIPYAKLARTYYKQGDYAKAAQYGESAVKNDPENPYRYGNLGWYYAKHEEFDKAVSILTLAIRGGTSQDGHVIQGLPLSNDYYVKTYYWYYGYSLASVKPNRCSEAIPVFNALLEAVPDDPITVENANYGLSELCGVKLAPTATPSPTPKPKK